MYRILNIQSCYSLGLLSDFGLALGSRVGFVGFERTQGGF